MSEWKLKRFWTDVSVSQGEEGHMVMLDARSLRTPAKKPLVLPNAELAERLAREWRAVQEQINPLDMPFTRSANAAIDKVAIQKDEVAELIAAYAGTDLLSYRADSPAELRVRQDKDWDPFLDWAGEKHGLHLKIAEGVMPVTQPDAALSRAREITQAMSAFELTAFHDLVSLTGSFVLGLAAAEQKSDPATLWKTSRIDETWQEEQWGADEEAAELAAYKRAQFLHAAMFFRMATVAT